MTKNRLRVKDLASSADIDLDEALVSLWNAGFTFDENSIISQRDVRKARQAVGLEDEKKLQSVDYWLERTGLNRIEFTLKIANHGIRLVPQARKLPKNSLSRIRSLFPESKIGHKPPNAALQSEISSPMKWEVVGTKAVQCYLTEDDVHNIHSALEDEFADSGDPITPPGIKSTVLLSSAMSRPRTSLGVELKYPTPEMAGAALFHSLVHNHAFYNGNKRTGLVSLIVFLDKNGLILTCSQDELLKKTLTLAKHGLVPSSLDQLPDREVLDLARWIRQNSRPIERGERRIKWHRLKSRLRYFDCEIEPASGVGNRLNITRTITEKGAFGRKRKKPLQVQVAFPGDGKEADQGVTHRIRQKLELDDAHGIDSANFYDGAEVDETLAEYRQVLKRLGRL